MHAHFVTAFLDLQWEHVIFVAYYKLLFAMLLSLGRPKAFYHVRLHAQTIAICYSLLQLWHISLCDSVGSRSSLAMLTGLSHPNCETRSRPGDNKTNIT